MGKGDRKANKKKRRQALDGCELKVKEIPKQKRDWTGRFVPQEDPQRTVLSARARQSGKKDDADTRAEMRAVRYGEAAGRALSAVLQDDTAKALFALYVSLTRSEALYAKYYVGMRLHAKTARIEMMPPADWGVRPDDKPDLRTEDERARDAVNERMRWHGLIGRLDADERTAIWDVVYGRAEPMDAGQVTPPGRAFVFAMLALGEIS